MRPKYGCRVYASSGTARSGGWAGHEETSDVSSDRMMTIVVRLDETLFIYRVPSDVRTL
jgi:hypothetical protein